MRPDDDICIRGDDAAADDTEAADDDFFFGISICFPPDHPTKFWYMPIKAPTAARTINGFRILRVMTVIIQPYRDCMHTLSHQR